MQRDHFLSRVESLQERLSRVKERIGLSYRQPATTEALGDLRTALEEMTLLEQQLVEQNKELAAAQESAEEETHRYQNLFELTPEAYLVTDRGGVVIEANEAAAALPIYNGAAPGAKLNAPGQTPGRTAAVNVAGPDTGNQPAQGSVAEVPVFFAPYGFQPGFRRPGPYGSG
jgi:hypothetical protein